MSRNLDDGAEHAPAAIVDGALARIRQHYLFPERLGEIEAEIRRRLDSGAYDGVADLPALCDALTADLRAVSGDKHFWLCYSPEPQAVTDEPARAPVSWEEQVAELTRHNFRFERLSGCAATSATSTSVDSFSRTSPAIPRRRP